MASSGENEIRPLTEHDLKEQGKLLSYDLFETISDREVSIWARETPTGIFS
jgi:hypothetical protein